MRQIVKIHIERDLKEEEIKYLNSIPEEEKQKLIDELKDDVYRMFEIEEVEKKYFKTLEIKIES